MRLAVVGTSNSVMKRGYTAGLAEHPATERLRNFSLGASTSVVLPKVVAEQRLDDDFVLLEFAVNEEYWVTAKASSIESIEQGLDDFVSRLGDEVTPAIVVMPTLTGLGKTLPVHTFYRGYASTRGYPLFDGFEFVAGRDDPKGSFQDRDHLAPDPARAFGTRIAARLAAVLAAKPTRSARPAAVPEHLFRALRPGDLADGSFGHRATSLTEASVAILGPAGRVDLAFDERVEVIGVGVNLAQSNGSFVLRSDAGQRTVGVAGGNYKGDGTSLVHVVLPVAPLAGVAFALTPQVHEIEPVSLEVSGVTCRLPPRPVAVPVYDLANVALSS